MSDPTSQTPPDSNQDASRNLEDQLSFPPEPVENIDIDRNELRASAAERAKQRPLLQKILSVFQKSKTSYRELIINSEPLEKRVALLLDG